MSDAAVALPAVPEALTRYTGFLLSKMGTITPKRFSTRLEALDLTPRMWGALNVLEAAGQTTQHGLCRRTGMDPSSMVATIDDLVARYTSMLGLLGDLSKRSEGGARPPGLDEAISRCEARLAELRGHRLVETPPTGIDLRVEQHYLPGELLG